jgi:hypothetical protein
MTFTDRNLNAPLANDDWTARLVEISTIVAPTITSLEYLVAPAINIL